MKSLTLIRKCGIIMSYPYSVDKSGQQTDKDTLAETRKQFPLLGVGITRRGGVNARRD